MAKNREILQGEQGIHIIYLPKDPNDPRRNKKWCVYPT